MSNRETYKEAKKTLSQINLILATEPLTAKQRKEFEHRAANLAGIILRLAPRPKAADICYLDRHAHRRALSVGF
jgi:hypothetical protein